MTPVITKFRISSPKTISLGEYYTGDRDEVVSITCICIALESFSFLFRKENSDRLILGQVPVLFFK